MTNSERRALVVTKEADLAAGIIAILEGLDYPCTHVRAGSSAARREVQEKLQTMRFDLIVAQQRMSPYSVFELLHDVDTFAGAYLPSVMCLADNMKERNAFIRRGGSAFVPFEPGQKTLAQTIDEGFNQVRGHRNFKKASKSSVLRIIDGFRDEHEFQKFIERIFRELDYSGVRRTDGRLESGRNVVCWENNRMGHREYTGVQVKMGDVHASAGTSGVGELRRLAIEAFGLQVSFADGDHDLDKFVIVTSGSINEFARRELSGYIRADHSFRRIYFLDREELADMVVRLCPALLARLE